VGSAAEDLRVIDDGLKATHPAMAEADLGVLVRPLRDDLLGAQAGLAVLVGLGAVLCVLLVSCVNVANLLLARSLSRETETGIRLALGAGTGRIIRLVTAEGLLLAAGGAVLGWVFSLWGLSLVTELTPESLSGGESLRLDFRVLGLTLAATMAAGLLCSVLPALRASRVDARDALAAGARTIVSSPSRTMHALVAVEVTLAFVLLFGAGLLARSYATLDRVDVGFRAEGLMLMQVSLGFLPDSPYARPETRRAFFEQVESSVEALPGVRRVGLAVSPPGAFSPNGRFIVEGRPEISGPHWRLVGADYFTTMAIPVRSGRVFADTDDAGGPDVAVINEALAALAFPGEDPMGQRISMPGIDGGPANPAAIVGIVANVRHRGPARAPLPEAYFSYRQRPWRTFGMTMIVDADRPAADLRQALQAAVRDRDPTVPPVFSTIEARTAAFLDAYRFRASLLGSLSGLAFALSLVGIAGVVSHTVARRHHEIGVRIALGATPKRIVALVVRSGLWPVAAGAVAGALGAMSLARLIDSFLFEIEPRDPGMLAAVAAAVVATAAVASWWPARRASRVNPIDALRP
jgi:predicted permease